MGNFSVSPLAIDAYARFGVDVFDERQIIGVSTVFQAFFGRAENGGKTRFSPDSVVTDIDILRGNERLAALVTRGQDGRDLGTTQANTIQEKFSTISRTYPLIEEEGDIDGDQLLFRRPGEQAISSATRQERLRGHAADIHQEHVRRIVRLFEYLAGQSLLVGKMPAIFGTTDANLLYDFLRPAAHIVTVGTKWDNAASTPYVSDIDPACNLIRANGHTTADMMLCGDTAFTALVSHAKTIALADNRRFELIEIGRHPVPPQFQRFVEAGAIPRGRLQTPAGHNLWVFTYLDYYTNASAVATKIMPAASALIASSTARCDRYFGPPERLPMVPQQEQMYQQYFGFAPGLLPLPPRIKNAAATIRPEMFYFDAYTAPNMKRITARTQAAPIFATTQTDGFVTLNGLV